MTVIVDASVAIKWVLEEDGSAEARSLLASEVLAAPDLMYVETANILWLRVRRGFVPQADAAAARCGRLAIVRTGAASMAMNAAAHATACELGQTVYDSLYLTVAIAEKAVFLTADKAFVRAAETHPVYGAAVQLLR